MTLTQEQLLRLQIEDDLVSEDSPEGSADRALRAELRLGLMPEYVPSLVAEVMQAIGGTPLQLGDAIRESAGRPPSLWAPVAAAIDAPGDGLGAALREALLTAADEATAGEAMRAQRSRWPWFAGVGIAAAAAAALLFFVAQAPSQMIEPVAGVIAPVVKVAKAVMPAVPAALDLPGITIIESLESETASVLQVLQFDNDAPTIIFIDDDPGE